MAQTNKFIGLNSQCFPIHTVQSLVSELNLMMQIFSKVGGSPFFPILHCTESYVRFSRHFFQRSHLFCVCTSSDKLGICKVRRHVSGDKWILLMELEVGNAAHIAY